jgi:predicted DNA-binding transcriptional regulator AlpA
MNRKALLMLDKNVDTKRTGPANDDEKLLDTPEAADFLGVSESFLVKARRNGTGPAFIRLGVKVIKYKKGTLRKYRDRRERR